MDKYGYEKGDDGLFHITMFGRRSRGFKPAATEEEARSRVASMYEGDRQADEADAIYSRMYCY